ncbi:hypothetical protein AB0K25_00540 [Micromonospora sp. NPDC049257]|uniref:hypothetical protein n=1 Tax=Micromonospora sp. NPDC049257 TaxID=3155771 RepID=UPI00342F28AA
MQRQPVDRWKIYSAFNQAIAEVFFTEDAAGLPVYLDFDEDTLVRIGHRLKLSTDKAGELLTRSAIGVLSLQTRYGNIFDLPLQHTRQWLRRWQQTPRDERMDLPAPPVLTLLAVFSMAAERMGSDATMAASNYFGPLSLLLRLHDPQQKERLAIQYRQHVELFWNVLGLWLTGLDGMYGMPSAVALSHRYVSLSMSQALVREHDRGKLPRFFAVYGLDPGREVTPREIEPYLDDWITRTPPPVSRNLATLWARQPAARERIASVVALELQTWDGSDRDGTPRWQAAGARGEARLVALIRSNLFGRKVEFSLVVKLPGHDEPRRLQIVSALGDQKPVLDFIPGINGWHRLHRPADLAHTSILDGVVQLDDTDGEARAIRRPRRVLPMCKDEALGLFLEVERLQLAEDGIVFAFDGLADEVDSVLAQVARPGYRRVPEGQEGVPSNWTMFADVQVLGLLPPEARAKLRDDLNVLQPSVSSQLTLAGGMKLPGRMRKYAIQAPPELRAVAVAAEHIKLEILRKDSGAFEALGDATPVALDRVIAARESDGSALMFPLSDEDLAEGDYEALLFVNRMKDATHRLPFYLRSGDYVDLALWARATRLAYLPGAQRGRGVLSADEYFEESAAVVDGVFVIGGEARAPRQPAPQAAWWKELRPPAGTALPATTLAAPDPNSCLFTRAHHWDLPYAGDKVRAVEGTCRRCGLVKRFPNTPWGAEARKKARDRIESRYQVNVHQVAPVQAGRLTWDIGLDALMHVGGGGYALFERIALQIEGSLLFVHVFARALESLGHVQIRRDPRSLEPLDWEIAPSTLAELVDGSYLLVGYWPAGYVKMVEDWITGTSGRLSVEPDPEGPSRRTLRGLTTEQVHELAAELGVSVAIRPAAAILGAVPGISEVLAALPRVSMPGARSVQQFHLGSAAWVTQSQPDEPGAYALESFGRTYVFRDAEDVSAGTARLGAANLVKHLAALQAGRPLLAYRAEERALDVPLGAELPGLYGRAAVICFGRPPSRFDDALRVLRYHDVPAEIAEMLTARLTS